MAFMKSGDNQLYTELKELYKQMVRSSINNFYITDIVISLLIWVILMIVLQKFS